MNVAVIADVHGNLPALEAVLSEIDRADVDLIVVAGDVDGGPFPVETIAPCARSATARASSRETLTATSWSISGTREADREQLAWAAQRLSQGDVDFLAAFEDTVPAEVDGLGAVLICHGSPRSDEEMVTQRTPESRVAPMSPTSVKTSSCAATRTCSSTARSPASGS